MLVHRVAVFWVMSDCIFRRHTHSSAFFIKMPCFFAEAKEVIFCSIHARIMAQASELIFFKSSLR